MKMTIAVAIMGGLAETKSVWGSWLGTMKGPVDLLIIDNAATIDEGQKRFFTDFVKPKWPGKILYAAQPDNLGVVKSLQFAYENTDSDIVAFIHNDLYIYEEGWDKQVINWFTEYPETGLLGFFGAEGVHPSSGRFNVWNNMLEAEIHGWRAETHKEVAVLDGLCMIASRKMLDVREGVDLSYDVHHFYDLDLSLESLDRGFKNYILPIYCHHQSGITACKPLFQEWANGYVEDKDWTKNFEDKPTGENKLYHKNLERFKAKWSHRLPYHIGSGWSG